MRSKRNHTFSNYWLRSLLLGLGLGLGGLSLAVPAPKALADDTAQETPQERAERLKKRAEERRKKLEAEREKRREAVEQTYLEMAKAYMSNDMETVERMYRPIRRNMRMLSREQQQNIRHMAEKAPEYRPDWWQGTKRQEKNSFKAEIWGRDFYANYVPTKELGYQVVYPEQEFNPRTGEFEIVDLVIMVTWKPLMVDSSEAADGRLAKDNKYTLGDVAEIIVWHELGHNYITENVPLRANIELYDKYRHLYSALHEYYADMTALYHSTPRARRVVLQFRLDDLDFYKKDQEHRRGAHGIGSIVLADMLMHPEKWPSVNFPPEVPKKQIELNTIIYVYENLGRDNWTVEEDIRLQSLAEEYILKKGEDTFKRKGEIQLPNNLKYRMLYGEDREHQKTRDEWVAAKLSDLRDAGRLDTLEQAGGKYDPPERTAERAGRFHGNVTIEINGEVVKDGNDEDAPKRIEVPWDY